MEISALDDTDSPPWEQIAPLLDEGLNQLNPDDRDALVLRFLRRQDFRAVGAALNISEDAAQKRVSRALEKLRAEFTRRGVTTTAIALTTALSLNAIQAAPAGLAATISAAAVLAGSTLPAATALAATKTIAMTTFQKTALTAALALVAGAGIYQASQASSLRHEIQTLRRQQSPLAVHMRELESARQAATNQLAALRAENELLKSNSNSAELLRLRGELTRLRDSAKSSTAANPREELMKSWLAREDKLRESVEQNPGKKIPEFQLLSDQQWLNTAMNASFDTDKDIQQNLANLRHAAENNFAPLAENALSKYMNANNGQFPANVSQLQAYFDSPMDQAILDRWQIVPQSDLPNQKMGGDWVITEKAPIDPALDQSWAIGQNGYGTSSYQTPEMNSAIATLTPVMKAYAAANNGSEPSDPSQILPYLTTPEQQTAFNTLMKNKNTPASSK
jgi:hypothetical protein